MASYIEDQTIPEDEDISYQINVKDKRYEASFYQKPIIDSAMIAKGLLALSTKEFTAEQLEETPTEEDKEKMLSMMIQYLTELTTKKSVWFMISESFGKYYISMFYDNEYNIPDNGEDL